MEFIYCNQVSLFKALQGHDITIWSDVNILIVELYAFLLILFILYYGDCRFCISYSIFNSSFVTVKYNARII